MSDQVSLLPAIIAVAVGMMVVMGILAAVLYQTAFGPRARLSRRVQTMFGGGGQRRGQQIAINPKRKQLKLRNQAEQAKKKGYAVQLRETIAQAGLSITVQQFFIFSAVFAVVAEALYFASGFDRRGLLLLPLITGLGIPRLIITHMRKRRLAQFLLQFPDALDVITRGLKSGLPVGECISVIGREMADPVATEFRIISESQKLAVPLDEALFKATERVPLPELRFLAIVIAIQQQTGGNLADTLGKLSEVIRLRKKMRDKVQALSAEAKASAMIIGSLPILVSILLSFSAPDYIGELIVKETGNTIILMGATTMSVGIFVMRQMINFDI